MPNNSCLATLVGHPNETSVKIHSGPGLSRSLVMQAPKGARGLQVLDAQPDENGSSRFGKTYQWLQLQFADGRTGWVRDDMVEISGNCTSLGYRTLTQSVSAFSLTRNEARRPESTPLVDSGESGDEEATRDPARQAQAHANRDLCRATVVGEPGVEHVNVRSGPGVNHSKSFQVDKGLANCLVTEVKPDAQGRKKFGKVHQWFNLTFPNGTHGWVRDDLVSIRGHCETFGYDDLEVETLAVSMTRSMPIVTERDRPPGGETDGRTTVTVNLSSPCKATVISGVPARVRAGRSTQHRILTELPQGTQAGVLDIGPQDGGGPHRWIKVEVTGQEGWMREDSLSYQGDCATFNLRTTPADLFPPPMRQFTWIRGMTPDHDGWDVSAAGQPVFSAPTTGTVMRVHECPNCTQPPGPAFRHHGITKWDEIQSALFERAWGWGFGHHVIVRYLSRDLPASTRKFLSNSGLAGAHLFVLYGHLQKGMSVRLNQSLDGETQLGLCGDSGYSTAPHLHLEVRAGTQQNMGSWMSNELLEPDVAFKQTWH